MRSIRAMAAACFAAAFLFAPAPALAAPSNTKVSKVFKLPCASSVCQSGEDSAASDGAVVADGIQVHVSASSTLGLSSVQLDARQVLNGDASSWVCMKRWGSSGTNFSDFINWNTNSWPGSQDDPPSSCSGSSFHGELTRNAVYDFRVVAVDPTGTTTSTRFSIKVSNKAETPSWADEPQVSGVKQRDPRVELRWKANPEPDVREYHFVREGPGGEEEYAVSATKPGGQGCDKEGDTYVCLDDDFPAAFGGEYTYTLLAFRTSPSSRQACTLPPYGDCTESSGSDSRIIEMTGPPSPGPDATESSSGGGGGGGSRSNRGSSPAPVNGPGRSSTSGYCWTCGKSGTDLPYNDQGIELPGGEGTTVAIGDDGDPVYFTDTSGRLRALRILAAGLVMLLVAAHLARLLRDPLPSD